jgi:hypothetical protein
VGRHIAFGSNEYKPGTIAGDTLLAHELAHVVQQGAAPPDAMTAPQADDAVENTADSATVGALASLWSGGKVNLSGAASLALERGRSGLHIARCSKSAPTPTALPMKTLELNMSKLEGSSRSFAVTDASAILEKAASITISAGTTLTVDKPTTEGLIGTDLILDEYTSPGTPTAEEVALTATNRTAGRITAYFVQSMSHGSHGESFWPSGFPTISPSVAIKNGDSPFVSGKPLAHELVHVLTDDGGHSSTVTNLMSYSNTGVDLDASQVTKARSSPSVK